MFSIYQHINTIVINSGMNNTSEFVAGLPFPDTPLGKLRELFSGHINLLCIDDDEPLCNLLCEEFFRSPIFHKKWVTAYDSARQAILGKVPYHCWLLDLTIDQHNDGLQLLQLKKNYPYCIVISGARAMTDATAAIKNGAYGAYDKTSVFTMNPNCFISEVCALSALSFLLKTRNPTRFEIYKILLSEFIRTPQEWINKSCTNECTLRKSTKDNSNLSPKQFLCMFNALYSVLMSDCLMDSFPDFVKFRDILQHHFDYYAACAEFVVSHMENVFNHFLKRPVSMHLP